MKRYLSTILIVVSVLILIIGLQFDLIWSGIASWGLTFICLGFATYCSKYIPNDEDNENAHKKGA